MNKNERVLEVDTDLSSPFFGRLLNWSHGWSELSIWHYGIGLSSDTIFDTGRGLCVFKPDFEPKFVIGVEEVHFSPTKTVQRLLHALDVFKDWQYGLLGWNCEHLARLVATGDPVSYEVLKSPPPIPQLNGNVRWTPKIGPADKR